MDSLPEELQFRNISSKKKTILEKQQRQVLPSNGTEQTANFSSGPQIVFRVPIDNEWSIQMDSAHIIADLTVKGVSNAAIAAQDRLKRTNISGAAAAGDRTIPILCPCESYESFIYRIAVYLNGSELERIDNYSYLETFKHNWCNNQNWVNLMSGGMGIGQSVLDKSRLLLVGAPSANNATTSNTIQIGFPLRYLGLMNIKTLLPAYLLGPNSLEIRIWMAPASECFSHGMITYNALGNANGGIDYNDFVAYTDSTLSYTLSNIKMNINYIQTEPSYNNALSQYLVSNNLQIPIETYFMTQFNIPRRTTGWITQNISVQYSNINAIYLIFTRACEQGNLGYLGTDRMHAIEGLSQARLTVNGKVLPSVPIQLANPGYANVPAANQNTTGAVAGSNYLASATMGQALCQQPEALNYLMKALGYNTSAEMLGQVNFGQQVIQPLQMTIADNLNSGLTQVTLPITGAGFNYASNKAVQNAMVVTANTIATTNNTNPLQCEEYYWKTPTLFALGWSMTRSDYSDEFELSGYNASSNSGIVQVGLQFAGSCKSASVVTAADAIPLPGNLASLTPVDDYTCWVIIEHTRVLDIGKDNAQVLY
jgi:hypothetical protein